MPLCMKGRPKIVKNSRTLDITRFIKKKKNKKHKIMKLKQMRERIKERKKKINKHCEILVSCSDKERNCMQALVTACKHM